MAVVATGVLLALPGEKVGQSEDEEKAAVEAANQKKNDKGDTAAEEATQTNESNIGRAKNKLKPDSDAVGDHSVFKRDPNTGEITNYKTYRRNLKNPNGFDEAKGYDGVGKSHKNKVTGEDLIPHVHDKGVPGGVRNPEPWEIPRTDLDN